MLKTIIESEIADIDIGFQVERSCLDSIFTLQQKKEKRTTRNHLIFVNPQKAYETIKAILYYLYCYFIYGKQLQIEP